MDRSLKICESILGKKGSQKPRESPGLHAKNSQPQISVMAMNFPMKSLNQSMVEKGQLDDNQMERAPHVAHGRFPCGDSHILQKRVLSNVLKPKIVSDPITMSNMSYGTRPQNHIATGCQPHNDTYQINLNSTIDFKSSYATHNY
jgi:hypothetical protein